MGKGEDREKDEESAQEDRVERETMGRSAEAIEAGSRFASKGKREGGLKGGLDFWQGKNLGRVGRKMRRGLRR